MKKSITAPLCSGLVIPGLGQILNQEIRKGMVLLGLVFTLFIAAAVKLAFIIKSMTSQLDLPETSHRTLLSGGDLLFMTVILGAFVILWVYAIVDAFWVARQSERSIGAKSR